jgi:hypothetical protein
LFGRTGFLSIQDFAYVSNIYCMILQVIRMVGESTEAVGAGVGGGSSNNKMPTLEEFGTNLTKLAEEVSFHQFPFLFFLKHN